jgi:hypothetical protein
MTQQTTTQPEPRVFVLIARWMSDADLAQFYHQKQQKINDARHKQLPETTLRIEP